MRLVSVLVAATLVVLASGQSRTIDREVELGKSVTLNCIADNLGGNDIVTWMKPDRKIEKGRTITILLTSKRMYGMYECILRRAGQRPITSARIRLLRPVRSLSSTDFIKVNLLESKTLTCPEYFGRRNTNWLRWDMRRQTWVQVRARGDKTYTIRSVRKADLTTWRCESSNLRPSDRGAMSGSYLLFAGYHKEGESRLTAKNELSAGHVVIPEDRRMFSMECEPAAGTSGMEIKWDFKGNADIDYSLIESGTRNYLLDNQPDLSVLAVQKCKTFNSGFYRCKSSDGTARYARLAVQPAKPKIHRWSLQTKTVKIGTKVAYHCEVSSQDADPSLIYWEFRPRGKENDPTATRRYEIGQRLNGVTVKIVISRSRLEIRNAQKRHSGRYYCVYNDFKDSTDLYVGSAIQATLRGQKRGPYYYLQCTARLIKRGQRASFQYSYFEQENGVRKRTRTRLNYYSTKDRKFVCVAKNRLTGNTAESNTLDVKAVSVVLTAVTPTGLRVGADMKMRCTVNDPNFNMRIDMKINRGPGATPRRQAYTRKFVDTKSATESSRTFDFSPARADYSDTYRCYIPAARMWSNPVKFTICRTNQRMCRDQSRCYETRQLCDKIRHCPDGSDEERNQCMECEPHSLPCGNFRGRRPEIKCVLKHWICDGQDDCGNGWDEEKGRVVNPYCEKHPLPRANCPGCNMNETCCADGRCFPRAYECDKEVDCPGFGGEGPKDETACRCDPTRPGIDVEEPYEETTRAVRVGSNLVLTCRVRSKERPTINWRFNWGHLPDDKRFVESMEVVSIVPEGTGAAEEYTVVGRLTVTGIKKATDFGRYTCEAITKCKRRLAPDYIVREDVTPPPP